MKIIDLTDMTELSAARAERLCVESIALGNFDGVHIGHAEIIRAAAAARNARPDVRCGVYTFEPYPTRGDRRCITTLTDKLELLAGLGADYALLEDFESVRGYSPEEFVERVLLDRFGCRLAVCGFNFSFGRGASGDADALSTLMAAHGAETRVIAPVERSGEPVSSTRIRALLEQGAVGEVSELLGRRFSLSIPVTTGYQRGRTIGIPTINQRFPPELIVPKHGVYASLVNINGVEHPGVTNIGVRPTVEDGDDRVVCETHIINYSGWLYGETLRVSLVKYLRDEQKFDSLDTLKGVIARDVEHTLELLGEG